MAVSAAIVSAFVLRMVPLPSFAVVPYLYHGVLYDIFGFLTTERDTKSEPIELVLQWKDIVLECYWHGVCLMFLVCNFYIITVP